jgi:hypothetical protein
MEWTSLPVDQVSHIAVSSTALQAGLKLTMVKKQLTARPYLPWQQQHSNVVNQW